MIPLKEILEDKLEKLRVSGSNLKALCPNPLHEDHKLGSFYISPEKGHMKCFSCGYYRHIFDFLLDSGVPIEVALDYYKLSEVFKKEPAKLDYVLGVDIPKSFVERGFSINTLKYFKVGYDSLNQRTTIPLYFYNELRGIYFRSYPKNIWHSDGFDRSTYIYNFDNTEERTYVEGLTDTLMTFQNGTTDVSCTLGSEISKDQIRLMGSHKVINLGYDFDEAGIEAMYFIYYSLRGSVEINVIPYKADLAKKNDPGNCSKKAWQLGFSRKVPFIVFDLEMIDRNKNLVNKIEQNLWKKLGK